MTATQPPLWPDDWTTEPCHDGLDPGLTAYLNALAHIGEARAAGGKRRWVYLDKPIHQIDVKGDLL
ncbi:hypothetical protein ACFWG6_31035 [Streptomyces erythrochromogenes]|uniref:hypothetical protein n=1 Tax=Streptomyces erythrochromogenes TaxID=285574 RepID=UPI003626657F